MLPPELFELKQVQPVQPPKLPALQEDGQLVWLAEDWHWCPRPWPCGSTGQNLSKTCLGLAMVFQWLSIFVLVGPWMTMDHLPSVHLSQWLCPVSNRGPGKSTWPFITSESQTAAFSGVQIDQRTYGDLRNQTCSKNALPVRHSFHTPARLDWDVTLLGGLISS